MLRLVSRSVQAAFRGAVINARVAQPAISNTRYMSHKVQETDEEFDARYVAYFSRPDIDGWEIRKGMNNLIGMDLVPDPKIISAALRACRRVNDHALTTRFLEAIKFRCLVNKDLYPYVIKEIRPTLDELGISTPEELGYDKPELALKSVFDVHG
ncbi:cytochrome c oxidase subunit 5A, mitochondrial [Folsomia candida]|uniref:cytochrome c oxidase subunit 5A, mitochondrial n=1 Tax=Folsomia candida TaxID=158441 RepID=UPI000B8F66BC|nr:cytochrome c oxidase subunit 5A, mitochondrial [Folsomia candida]